MDDKASFTVTFDPELSTEQRAAALLALEAYWIACGGTSFKVVHEPAPPPVTCADQHGRDLGWCISAYRPTWSLGVEFTCPECGRRYKADFDVTKGNVWLHLN